jgi:hypothetical protein
MAEHKGPAALGLGATGWQPRDRDPNLHLQLLIATRCRCRWFLLHQITRYDMYTLCGSPLDEGLARRTDMHVPVQHQTFTTDIHVLAGFEPAVTASERPKTYALDRTSARIGKWRIPFHNTWEINSLITLFLKVLGNRISQSILSGLSLPVLCKSNVKQENIKLYVHSAY